MQKTKGLARGAMLAAAYVVLTYLQNILFPNSTSFAIQFRASEALCVLAFFTPAAMQGLSIGCLIFNILSGATPIDFLIGSLASFLAAWAMWHTRKITVKGYPLLGMLMPALFNAVLVGWELTVYLGDTGFTMAAFWINALYVAIGELIVLFTLGLLLHRALNRGKLGRRVFG